MRIDYLLLSIHNSICSRVWHAQIPSPIYTVLEPWPLKPALLFMVFANHIIFHRLLNGVSRRDSSGMAYRQLAYLQNLNLLYNPSGLILSLWLALTFLLSFWAILQRRHVVYQAREVVISTTLIRHVVRLGMKPNHIGLDDE